MAEDESAPGDIEEEEVEGGGGGCEGGHEQERQHGEGRQGGGAGAENCVCAAEGGCEGCIGLSEVGGRRGAGYRWERGLEIGVQVAWEVAGGIERRHITERLHGQLPICVKVSRSSPSISLSARGKQWLISYTTCGWALFHTKDLVAGVVQDAHRDEILAWIMLMSAVAQTNKYENQKHLQNPDKTAQNRRRRSSGRKGACSMIVMVEASLQTGFCQEVGFLLNVSRAARMINL